MSALIGAARGLAGLNGSLLALGRWAGALCVAVMVGFILAQVWFRYVIGDALAWSEEAARFLMLWMTGLMAPTAFRRGGFVAIDMVQMMLPRAVAGVLQLALLALSLLVLVMAFRIGMSELGGLGARFATSSLWYPSDLSPLTWEKVPRGWMMASIHVGVSLLLLVNIELLLRTIIGLSGHGDDLPPIPEAASLAGAE